MTLEHFYYIAELVAALALVISLIYVGIQVKLSTKAPQAATAQSYVDTMNVSLHVRHSILNGSMDYWSSNYGTRTAMSS